MHTTTANNWNLDFSDNNGVVESKFQDQVTKVKSSQNLTMFTKDQCTQSDFIYSLINSNKKSTSGFNSISIENIDLEFQQIDRTNIGKLISILDPANWNKDRQEVEIKIVNKQRTLPFTSQINFSDLITFIRYDLVKLADRNSLANRILELSTIDDLVEKINIKSLTTFVMFLSSNKIEKIPSVGLDRDGFIDALWRKSKEQLVEIIFLPGHESHVVTFSPDLEDRSKINRRVATIPITNVMEIISNRNLRSLLINKEN